MQLGGLHERAAFEAHRRNNNHLPLDPYSATDYNRQTEAAFIMSFDSELSLIMVLSSSSQWIKKQINEHVLGAEISMYQKIKAFLNTL